MKCDALSLYLTSSATQIVLMGSFPMPPSLKRGGKKILLCTVW